MNPGTAPCSSPTAEYIGRSPSRTRPVAADSAAGGRRPLSGSYAALLTPFVRTWGLWRGSARSRPPGCASAYGFAVVVTRLAQSVEEREAIQRFRYDVYVEELHRYGQRADHGQRMLVDEEDEWSWLLYTTDGEDILATTRITWGGHGFSERQIEQYRLTPFLAELPHEVLSVGERVMVRPGQRGSEVTGQLFASTQPIQHDQVY